MRLLPTLALTVLLVLAATPTLAGTLEDFGGHDGILRVTTDFVTRVVRDTRINRFFAHANGAKLIQLISSQVCEALGGPCRYTGRSMKDTHRGMGVTSKDFNALVEDLCDAMDAARIPAHAQNKLLAKLAPMWRDIVTR